VTGVDEDGVGGEVFITELSEGLISTTGVGSDLACGGRGGGWCSASGGGGGALTGVGG